MKKRKLKKWVKYTLLILIISIIVILIHIDTQAAYKYVNKCVLDGYSNNYCMAQLGIY